MRDLQRQIEQQVSVDSHQGINTFIIEVVKTIKRVSFTSTYNTRVTGEKIVQSRFFWTRFRVLDSQFNSKSVHNSSTVNKESHYPDRVFCKPDPNWHKVQCYLFPFLLLSDWFEMICCL